MKQNLRLKGSSIWLDRNDLHRLIELLEVQETSDRDFKGHYTTDNGVNNSIDYRIDSDCDIIIEKVYR